MDDNSSNTATMHKSLHHQSIDPADSMNDSFISYGNRKKSNFKKTLINSLFFYDKHPSALTVFKVLIGFSIISLPSMTILTLSSFITPVFPTKYLFLPYIITFTISTASIIMTLVVKTRYNFLQSGLLISSWERLGILRLIGSLVINCFTLSILMRLESIGINIPFYQGNVSQFDTEGFPAKQLTQGSFFFRLIFIGLFWNKDYDRLGYFSIDNRFLVEFKESLTHLFNSVLAISAYYLIKITFIQSKNTVAYLVITIATIYECCVFIYYPIDNNGEALTEFWYRNSKYFEVMPLFGILFSVVWIAIKNNIIRLVRKKLYPYRTKKKNYFTIVTVFFFFGCIVVGLTLMLYVCLHLLFVDIEATLEYECFNHILSFLLYGLFLLSIGFAFQYGDYYFALLYKPIVYEFCQAMLKNYYYIRCSNNLNRIWFKTKGRGKGRDKGSDKGLGNDNKNVRTVVLLDST